MTIEQYYILSAYGSIEESQENWTVNNLQKKLREMNKIEGLSSQEKIKNLVNEMVYRGMPIRKFDNDVEKKIKSLSNNILKKYKDRKTSPKMEKERKILEAFNNIEQKKEIWSQKNLERKLRELGLIGSLTDKKARLKLVNEMVLKGYPIRMFDTIENKADDKEGGLF